LRDGIDDRSLKRKNIREVLNLALVFLSDVYAARGVDVLTD